jgi:hypothetical protein
MARFAPPDRLLYVRDDSLVAQSFDLANLQLTGEPTLIAKPILRTPSGRVAVSASRTGVVVFASSDASADSFEAVWLDRTGNEIPSRPPPLTVGISGVRLSRNGRLLAFGRSRAAGAEGMSTDLWLYDTTRQIETPLATDLLGVAGAPVFSPDDTRVIVRRQAENNATILQEQPVWSGAPAEPVLKGQPRQFIVPWDWSSDGRHVIYGAFDDSDRGLWILPLTGARQPIPYLKGWPVPARHCRPMDAGWPTRRVLHRHGDKSSSSGSLTQRADDGRFQPSAHRCHAGAATAARFSSSTAAAVCRRSR